MRVKPLTVNDFLKMKKEGSIITALTAYDAIFASLLDEAGIDLILVGDSLAQVFQGHETTIPVTLDHMIYHGEIVVRSVKRAFVCVDMPFMTFQISPEEALRNAGAIMQNTGCKAVKLEGGIRVKETIRKIVDAGIPVLGHIGLTPQSVHAFGGFGVRGRKNRQEIIDDAIVVEDSGAFAVVLEKIPGSLAKEITETLSIPTIGIGAGQHCDGQVLVTQDMLGLFRGFYPTFVRRYAELANTTLESVKQYIRDVKEEKFPSEKESYE